MESTRVLLADRQALATAGLRHFLMDLEGFKVVGESSDAAELSQLIEQAKPEILVLDYAQIRNFSEGLSAELASRFPWLKIIIITNDHNPQHILKNLQANVMGFITKECSKQEILNTFKVVRNGQKFFCNRVMDLLMEKRNKPLPSLLQASLSEREIQIIAFISRGLSTQQMASELHLSTHTINAHRKNILKKLEVNTPVELVVKAIQSGIIKLEGNQVVL